MLVGDFHVFWSSIYDIFFLIFRFNYFEESKEHDDSLDVDTDESVWPSFSSISKTAGFLDKELAASGFTRKEQDDIEKVGECHFANSFMHAWSTFLSKPK